MKIVLCSLAGSVGKTTITVHLLHPRMPSAKLYSVDNTNVTAKNFGLETELFSGDEFEKMYKHIVRNNDIIIDVGGSKEGKEFLSGMEWMEGHDEIDAFIVPAGPDHKDQEAAFKTIQLLLAQGVERSKIKVVFNLVDKNLEEEFDWLLGALVAHQIQFSTDAAIKANKIYNKMMAMGRSIDAVVNDPTDYKAIVKETNDEDELNRASDFMFVQKTARKINEQLDVVFNALFPAVQKTSKRAAKAAE